MIFARFISNFSSLNLYSLHSRSNSVWFLVFTLVLLRGSFGPIPSLDYFKDFALGWPSIELGPAQVYIKSSPIGQILFQVIPYHSVFVFLLIHFFAILITFFLLYKVARINNDVSISNQIIRILILGQFGFVLFRWIGAYDAFSVLVWAGFLLSFTKLNTLSIIIFSFFIGFQNFEQGFLGLILLFAIMKNFTPNFYQSRNVFKVFFMLFIGKLTLSIILFKYSDSLPIGRFFYFKFEILFRGILDVAQNFPLFIYSLFGPIYIVLFYIYKYNRDILIRKSILISTSISLFASIFAIDHSRVFVLVTFPALFWILTLWVPVQNYGKLAIKYTEIFSWAYIPLLLWGGDVVSKYGNFRGILNSIGDSISGLL